MLLRRRFRCVALLGALLLAGCSPTPDSLLQDINAGDAASALNTLDELLAKSPTDGTLQLLAAHARLQACAARNCATSATPPALLEPVAGLLQSAPDAVTIGEDAEAHTLSQSGIILSATTAFARLPSQPAALLALYNSLPKTKQQGQLASLWQPTLAQLRAGNTPAALAQLQALVSTPTLPEGLRYSAGLMAALLQADTNTLADMRAALRAKPALAANATGAGQLVPHLLRQNLPTEAALINLPLWFETSQTLGPLANPDQAHAAAAELAFLASPGNLPARWASGWETARHGPLELALQRASLRLNPNQTAIWERYLPALVAAAQSHTTLPEFSNPFRASGLSGPSAAQLGTALLKTAATLKNRPSLAAPLLQLASQLNLPTTQQVELDKLAQSLLIKAAEAKDITATLALAEARPQAAANNRQQVVPLLVEDIRNSLRSSQFERAVSTSTLMNGPMALQVELGPLVLEEFNATTASLGLSGQGPYLSPTVLLQPRDAVLADLGPLWGFMQDYFAGQPEILRGQLNALIAAAEGPYGPPSLMHKLLPHFPEDEQAQLESWLNNAIVASVQADESLDGPAMTTLASQLVAIHPTLPLAPILETALNRTPDATTSRALWQATTPQVRTVIRAIRPQFAALMRAIDANAAQQPNLAAEALNQLTEATWLTQAEPVFENLHQQLAQIAGAYVPLSAAPEAPLAMLTVNPQGLMGGDLQRVGLTFLNRLGTLANVNPTTLVSTPSTLRQLTLQASYNLATRKVSITPAVLASAPEGASLGKLFGDFTSLQFKPSPEGTLLEATLRNGQVVRLSRVTHDPTQPLFPNGQYALTTPLEQTLTPQPAEAKHILPPGSILTLQAAPSTQPASADYGFSGDVYPLLGTLQHPARNSPISFTGEFDAKNLATGFTFSYPLPQSGQTVRAAVKCQTLGGPVTCGAHHLHSPRLAYATLIRGLQTQESLREQIAVRQTQNTSATAILLAQAATRIMSRAVASPVATILSATIPPEGRRSGSTPLVPSLASGTVISPSPALVSETESEEPALEAEASPTLPARIFGTFIHRSAPSPTTPAGNVSGTAPSLDNLPRPR